MEDIAGWHSGFFNVYKCACLNNVKKINITLHIPANHRHSLIIYTIHSKDEAKPVNINTLKAIYLKLLYK